MNGSKQYRALLVEDNKILGIMILLFLRSWGFAVTWVYKVLTMTDEGARCLCRDPSTDPSTEPEAEISWTESEKEISWTEFDLVLLDGLMGPTASPKHGPHGWDILPYILHLLVIAISSEDYMNEVMIKGGAKYGVIGKRTKPESFKITVIYFLRQMGFLPKE